jgi:hypothetical protein
MNAMKIRYLAILGISLKKIVTAVLALSNVIVCGSVRKTIINDHGRSFAISSARLGLIYAPILVTETMIIPKNIISWTGLDVVINTKRNEKIRNQTKEYNGKITTYFRKYKNLLMNVANLLFTSISGVWNRSRLVNCLW